MDHERIYVTMLKGLAITAVVTLHVFSALPALLYKDPSLFPYFITIDQLSRFCVPLFIAISGYGLSKKYLRSPIGPISFYKKRVFKLIPLYVLWSCLSLLILSLSPTWRTAINGNPIWIKLLWGQADYHYYFIPIIFQLYLLFPLLHFFVKRLHTFAVIVALLVQGITFWIIAQGLQGNIEFTSPLTDQRQYLWISSWIFYFVLGMAIALVDEREKRKRMYVGILLLTLGAFWAIQTGLQALDPATDTILLLRTTRFPVLLYATGWILFALHRINKHATPLHSLLLFLGKHSYLIYLSHTLLLRIVMGQVTHTIALLTLIFAVAIWLTGWVVSLRVSAFSE